MRRSPALLLAAMAAAIYGAKAPIFAPSVQAPGQRVGGMTAPQGGIGSLLHSMQLARAHGAGGAPSRPRFKTNTGFSCAEGKRRARRRRNQLRAKGQYRSAVR